MNAHFAKLKRAKLRPWKIGDVVDGWKLRVQLTAAAHDFWADQTGLRARVLDLFKGALFRGRMIAKERLEAGAGGVDCAEILAAVQDEVISALYDFTTTHIFRVHNRTTAERLSICATGGYGRNALAPSSDIDILFVRPTKDASWAEGVIEYMLYMMWDMGLKVGNASRTIAECLRAAKEDFTIRTAVLETRFICGDENIFKELESRLRNEIFLNTGAEFIGAKLKERDNRHKKSGESRYMVEPNIKDGKGGLRDLHTMFWITKYLHNVDLADTKKLIEIGIFTKEQAKTLDEAAEFLWTVRCHLHFLTGRPEERLTFDLQPEMARMMGYGDRADNPAVERFMKHYFLITKSVGVLTRVLSAKLEAEHLKNAPKGIAGMFLAAKPKATKDQRFVIIGGRIGFANLNAPKNDMLLMLELFVAAHEHNLDIEPNSLAKITELAPRFPSLAKNDRAIQIFLDIMSIKGGPFGILNLMNETGLLGRMIPEFGRIVGQTQFNMYHHFTVDEHTLRAVQILGEIENGVHPDKLPLITSIFHKINNRRGLYLAMLLHDVGKGEGDQQILGAIAAQKVCKRLGIPDEEIELVAWLVGHHLIMSDTAQKRDLGDPTTIAKFAESVTSLEKLRLLLALTVADIRAVGPGVWNDWKAQLLRDLYKLTEATLRGGRADEHSVRRVLAQGAEEARRLATKDSKASEWLGAMDDSYWLGFDESQHLWHADEVSKMVAEGKDFCISYRIAKNRGATEILIIAPDREGLFQALASVFAYQEANVLDARVFTSGHGQAFDVFAIQGIDGEAFGIFNQARIKGLLQHLEKAALEGYSLKPEQMMANITRRVAAFRVEPFVIFDNEASNFDTVIEVSGRDRPGFLADIANVFQSEALNLTSAHIGSIGERAQDAFYVRARNGVKILEAHRLERLQNKLIEILGSFEPAAPTLVSKRKLAQARASLRR
jgi:[protein-PII] uridylyltransferase